MMLRKWERIPELMRTEETLKYYNILKQKKCALFFKRIFDIVVSFIMLMALLPIFIVLSVAIKIDSKGPVFYRQIRVTQYCKTFRIYKFRTMVHNADKIGSQVTVSNDSRVTRVGRFIRKFRLDEICQLIDVLRGTMTFVGTRPEVPKYVEEYTPEMMATLLMPAGVTSLASIYYKNEAKLLDTTKDIDKVYIEKVLPAKMYYNLNAMKNFSFWGDIKILFMTVFAVLGKEYEGDYVAQEKIEELVK
jgi:lipopolysaccharide/colanic/teichoic acid biosynthesis glycosyltransferase